MYMVPSVRISSVHFRRKTGFIGPWHPSNFFRGVVGISSRYPGPAGRLGCWTWRGSRPRVAYEKIGLRYWLRTVCNLSDGSSIEMDKFAKTTISMGRGLRRSALHSKTQWTSERNLEEFPGKQLYHFLECSDFSTLMRACNPNGILPAAASTRKRSQPLRLVDLLCHITPFGTSYAWCDSLLQPKSVARRADGARSSSHPFLSMRDVNCPSLRQSLRNILAFIFPTEACSKARSRRHVALVGQDLAVPIAILVAGIALNDRTDCLELLVNYNKLLTVGTMVPTYLLSALVREDKQCSDRQLHRRFWAFQF